MKHRLLSAASAMLFGDVAASAAAPAADATAAPAPAAATAPAPLITPTPAQAPAPAASTGTAAAAGDDGEETIEVVSAEEARSAVLKATNDGKALGAKEERERTHAVMSSAGAQANANLALWLLANNPGATAEAINTHLAAAPAAAAPAAAAASAVTVPLAQTPQIDVNARGNANDGNGGASDAKAMWDAEFARANTAHTPPSATAAPNYGGGS